MAHVVFVAFKNSKTVYNLGMYILYTLSYEHYQSQLIHCFYCTHTATHIQSDIV